MTNGIATRALRAAVSALLLSLAACTSPAATPTAPSAPSTRTEAPAPEATATLSPATPSPTPAATATPAATQPGGLQGLQVEAAPSLFVQRQFKSGDLVVDPGAYFLRTATGDIEGWTLAGDEGRPTYQFVSYDNRWVEAFGRTVRGLLDRRTGRGFGWASTSLRVLAAQGERLLFADDAHIWLAPADLHAALALKLVPKDPWAAFSSDGNQLLLLNDATLYQVDEQSGALRTVGQALEAPAGYRRQHASLIAARRGREAVLVTYFAQDGGSRYPAVSQRFSYQGEKLGQVPGECSLSRDGRLVAWEEDLDGVSPSVVVAETDGLRPLLRVKGAMLCFSDMRMQAERWLADGSGLVVTVSGGYRLVTLDGQLHELPVSTKPWLLETLPAPDRADLLAVNRTQVVDRNGTRLAGVTLSDDRELAWPAHEDPWGQDSSELRFSLPHLGHGGFCGGAYLLPPAVERAPFAAPMLVVGLPANDCVQLRELPGTGTKALTCLPGGTLLTVASSTPAPVAGQAAQWAGLAGAWRDGEYWLRVRTAAGLEGWVAAGAGKIGWAQ